LLDSIETFLFNREIEIRKQAIIALGEIGTEKSNDILSGLIRLEKDSYIISFVKKVLAKNK